MVSVCPHNCPPDSDAGCLLESAPLTTQSHLQSWLKSDVDGSHGLNQKTAGQQLSAQVPA